MDAKTNTKIPKYHLLATLAGRKQEDYLRIRIGSVDRLSTNKGNLKILFLLDRCQKCGDSDQTYSVERASCTNLLGENYVF